MSVKRDLLEKVVHDLYLGVYSQKKFELVDDLYTENAVIWDGKNKVFGRDKIKELILLRSQAIPDFHFTLDDILIDGNKAATRWHGTGHVIKDIAGFKKGRSASYWGVSMCEVNDEGRMIKDWYNSSIIDVF